MSLNIHAYRNAFENEEVLSENIPKVGSGNKALDYFLSEDNSTDPSEWPLEFDAGRTRYKNVPSDRSII